jgi:hypothetical protein
MVLIKDGTDQKRIARVAKTLKSRANSQELKANG